MLYGEPMRTPSPNQKEVAEFAALYKESAGIDLSPADALETATRILRLFFFKSGYAFAVAQAEDKLIEKMDRKRRSAKRKVMKRYSLPLVPHDIYGSTNYGS
jgi:hypothetical protein